jgi:hypothetical protein
VRSRLQRRFHQLVYDMFRRRPIGVTHAKVDNVLANTAGRDLHLPRYVEYVRREALNTTELFHRDSISDELIMNRTCAVESDRNQESGADGPDSELCAGFWDGKCECLGGCRRSTGRSRAGRAQRSKGAETVC